MEKIKIAFIGAGNMAQALAKGLVQSGFCQGDAIHAIDPHYHHQAFWEKLGASVNHQADQQLTDCNIWFMAVKPQIMPAAAAQYSSWLDPNTLVISVAAGITSTDLSRWLAKSGQNHKKVVRCMPNTPSLIAQGITGLTALDTVSEPDRELATKLLQAVGDTVWVQDDNAIDALTSISGCGPAYLFLFLECLINAGIKQGLDPAQAEKLALATFRGAAKLAYVSSDTPAELRQKVTSKGGATAAAIDVFQTSKLQDIFDQAVSAARNRAAELAK